MAGHAHLRRHVLDNLDTSNLIGRGSFGKVYEVDGPGKEKYALKVYAKVKDKVLDSFLAEMTNMARFSHPHIVKYVSGWEERDRNGHLHAYLLMEHCGLDLKRFLEANGRARDDKCFGNWLSQIASGLHHMHGQLLLHRNVKTSNIMVQTRGNVVILKIGDFGVSKILDSPDAWANSKVGNTFFMSPEILSGVKYNHKTDIWSFGCTAFEIATGKMIFQVQTLRTFMFGIKKGIEELLAENIQYDAFFSGLIGKMLDIQADKRPDAAAILENLAERCYTVLLDLDTSVSSIWSQISQASSTRTLTPVPEVVSSGNRMTDDTETFYNRGHVADDNSNRSIHLDGDRGYHLSSTAGVRSRSSSTSDSKTSGSGARQTQEPEEHDSTEQEQENERLMNLLASIKKYQSKITKQIGQDRFSAAYESLAIPEQDVRDSVMRDILKEDYSEIGSSLVYLELLESELEKVDRTKNARRTQGRENTLTGGPLSMTR